MYDKRLNDLLKQRAPKGEHLIWLDAKIDGAKRASLTTLALEESMRICSSTLKHHSSTLITDPYRRS